MFRLRSDAIRNTSPTRPRGELRVFEDAQIGASVSCWTPAPVDFLQQSEANGGGEWRIGNARRYGAVARRAV